MWFDSLYKTKLDKQIVALDSTKTLPPLELIFFVELTVLLLLSLLPQITAIYSL